MWTSDWHPGQGVSTKAPQAQTDDRDTRIEEQLQRRNEAQDQVNHIGVSMSPSKNISVLNVALTTSNVPTPTQAFIPRVPPQTHTQGSSVPTRDEIGDFIAGISAEWSDTMSRGDYTLEHQTPEQHRASSSTINHLQAPALESSNEHASKYSPRSSRINPCSLNSGSERVSVSEQESVRRSNRWTASPNTATHQSRGSPEEGEVTNNPSSLQRDTSAREQPLVAHATDALRMTSEKNVTRPVKMPPKKEPSGCINGGGSSLSSPQSFKPRNPSNAFDRSRSQSQQEKRPKSAAVDGDQAKELLQLRDGPSQVMKVARDGDISPSGQVQENPSGLRLFQEPSSISQVSSMARDHCISQDKDLSDWLEFTGFHNAQYRARYLARQRKVAALDKLRAEIMEEEELDRPSLASSSQISITTHKPNLSSMMAQNAINTDFGSSVPVSSMTNNTSPLLVEVKETAKRCRDDKEAPEPRAGKTQRTEHTGGAEQTRSNTRYEDTDGVETRQDGLPNRPPSPRPISQDSKSLDQQSHEHHRRESTSSRRPLSSKSGNWDDFSAHPRSTYSKTSYSTDSKKLDLGSMGETRFFAIKSYSDRNVNACQKDGLWVTQTANSEIFTKAFAECKNVILVFSVNKSRAFQGYARMVTAPSLYSPEPQWLKYINFDTSAPFRIEWFCTTEMPFSHIHELHNRLNEDKSVIVGKDGQEIDETCGRELIRKMDKRQEDRWEFEVERAYDDWDWDDGRLTPPFVSSSSRGAYRGRGGRGSPRGRGRPYVKREWF